MSRNLHPCVEHKGLVCKLAWQIHRPGVDIDDLIQEGMIGLLVAIRKYDAKRGVKFTSFAVWWIRAYMLKYVVNNARLVKLGTTQHQRKIFFNGSQARREIEAAGLEPSPERLAIRLGVHEHEVREMQLRLAAPEASLDDPLPPVASKEESAEEQLGQAQEIERLHRALRLLPLRERQIVREHFLREKDLKTIGARFGITKERTRQIGARGLKQLRRKLEKAGVTCSS